MPDIFQRNLYAIQRPITADMCYIDWAGSVAQATNVNIQYQQGITRRYTLASAQNLATIYPSRPTGTMTIARLICENEDNLFTRPGFNVCSTPTDIRVYINGTASSLQNCNVQYGTYTARGCFVTNYSFGADADSLSVVDNLVIEFLQLDYNPATNSTEDL